MIAPTRAEFLKKAQTGQYSPLRVHISADLETPVSVFLKLKPLGAVFLFESVDRAIQVGRYSFIGLSPRASITLQDGTISLEHHSNNRVFRETFPVDPDDPLGPVRNKLADTAPSSDQDQNYPAPLGGAVGYLGYNLVQYFDKIDLPESCGENEDLPDYQFIFPGTLAVFDHVKSAIEIITLPDIENEPQLAYDNACREINRLLEALSAPLSAALHTGLEAGTQAANTSSNPQNNSDPFCEQDLAGLTSNQTRESFCEMVAQAKEHILAGDAFQIVLSQRLTGSTDVEPFQIYRALRILNPSPYLFFLDLENFQLIGSSPEMLVKSKDDVLQVNPIAGTRPRGRTIKEDQQLAEDLLADEKERAEHVMLVDLGRNDLGRVCDTGSILVDDFMSIERYSHVMHIVSRVSGRQNKNCDLFDALKATFPAGTVTGAPKVRAMQIISDLEKDRRGTYAGALGYFGTNGSMDLCITIRTLMIRQGQYSIQGGAGIVADSDPNSEYQETLNKIQALVKAVRIAEKGQNNDSVN